MTHVISYQTKVPYRPGDTAHKVQDRVRRRLTGLVEVHVEGPKLAGELGEGRGVALVWGQVKVLARNSGEAEAHVADALGLGSEAWAINEWLEALDA